MIMIQIYTLMYEYVYMAPYTHIYIYLYIYTFTWCAVRHGFTDLESPRVFGVARTTSNKSVRADLLMPLHVAAQIGDSIIVTLLLEAGVDPHSLTIDGQTALDIAWENNMDDSHLKVIRKLARSKIVRVEL